MSEEINLLDKKYLAEFLGTLILIFIGCGSIMIAGGEIGFLGIAFAFGITFLVLYYAIGPISGCHINPAVTVAMLVSKKIKSNDAMMYIIYQCIGAIVGVLLLFAILSGLQGYDLGRDGLGANGFDDASPMGFPIMSAFIAEVFLTFIFILVFFGATSKNANKCFSGAAIGLTLALTYIVAMPITWASINPARSLGPALVAAMENTFALEQVWLFWLAPIIGAVIAAFVWKEIFEK